MGRGRPLPPSPILSWSARGCCGPSRGFVPPGHLGHSRGVGALWRLNSPAHSVVLPLCVSCHSGGLASPLLFPHLGDSWATPEASRPLLSSRTPEVSPPLFSHLHPFPLFVLASPHGSPALLPSRRTRRRISRCRPRWPSHPFLALPRRYLACPMTLP